MPRPHTNTCNAVLDALENMRDMDQAEIAMSGQPIAPQHHEALRGWKRGDDLEPGQVRPALLELARDWGELYVAEGMSECDCDAKHVHVIARRWHRSHATTAPARVIARITTDAYLVRFLTPGPGQPEQAAYRHAMGVAPDDAATLDALPIDERRGHFA
jgi:hypothetical protein